MTQWIRSMDRFTHVPLRACSQHLSDKTRHNPLLMTAKASLSDGWLSLEAPPQLIWYSVGDKWADILTFRQLFLLFQLTLKSLKILRLRTQTSCHLLWEQSHMVHFGCLMFTLFTSETLCSEVEDTNRHFHWSMLTLCVTRELAALSLLSTLSFPPSLYLCFKSPWVLPISQSTCFPVSRSLLLKKTLEWL